MTRTKRRNKPTNETSAQTAGAETEFPLYARTYTRNKRRRGTNEQLADSDRTRTRQERPIALAAACPIDYLEAMDTAPTAVDGAQEPGPETAAERQDRLAWEAKGIAEAEADVAAGRLVDAAAVRAWVESIDTDHELSVPYSGR